MTGFSALEVALGRYLVYGIISLCIFFKTRVHHPRSIWTRALYFSLISTIGYYTFLVLALRYSSPAICALILGISPITIAFYGNLIQKETPYKKLIFPSILILIGLVLINLPHLLSNPAPTQYVLGLVFSLLALASWSWYVVSNARFLKHHPKVHSSDWSTMIGVATLFWVALFAAILGIFFAHHLNLEKCFFSNEEFIRFIIGSCILGILCSWVGAFLWNLASVRLPVSLAGQLTIFETIFGVIFVYLVSWSLPSILEIIGIVILFLAVVYGIKQFARKKMYTKEIEPH